MKFLVDTQNRIYQFLGNFKTDQMGTIGITTARGCTFDHWKFLCAASTQQNAYDWITNHYPCDTVVYYWSGKGFPIPVQFDIHGLPAPENAPVMPMNGEKFGEKYSID